METRPGTQVSWVLISTSVEGLTLDNRIALIIEIRKEYVSKTCCTEVRRYYTEQDIHS